jgi:hypothetical protein
MRAPGLVHTFLCNCTDYRKITTSTSAANLIVRSDPPHLIHLRGEANDPIWHLVDDQVGSRDGQLLLQDVRHAHVPQGRQDARCEHPPARDVDDFSLAEGVLKPTFEIFTETRVGWASPAEGDKQSEQEGYAEDA